MLSIIIPSVNEFTLQRTVDEVREKVQGDYEIIVVFDGVQGHVDNVDIVLYNRERLGLRSTVNRGVSVSSGDVIMKVDEHCNFDDGFAGKLIQDLEDNMILIPRRYKLNIETWELYPDPPIDHERLVIDRPEKIGGVRWPTRDKREAQNPLSETMVFQGSFYMMKRSHWDRLGGLDSKGYGEFAQEAIELSLKTWLGGGRVVTSKKTWYGHKHRDFKRVVSPSGVRQGNKYSQDYWLNNRWEERKYDLDWLMKRFGL